MRIQLWDLPLRVFHWLLFLCVVGAFVTQKIGGDMMVWHGRLGLTILGLLVFRVVWGFVGSTYARFSYFVSGPHAIRRYLSGQWSGVGHNPLGAYSVLALLSVLAWLALTGLFANDDIAFNGPLQRWVDYALSGRLTDLHKAAEPVLMGLVGLHIGAIAYYVRIKKRNLLIPMITGVEPCAPDGAHDARGGGLLAFVFALALALAAVYVASGQWLPDPAALGSPASAPSW